MQNGFFAQTLLVGGTVPRPGGRYSNSVTVQHSPPNDDMMRQLRKKCYSVAIQTMTSMVWTTKKTRPSWLNCALRDDEAVYWVSIGHYEAVAVGN